jgi:hypothetical protein
VNNLIAESVNVLSPALPVLLLQCSDPECHWAPEVECQICCELNTYYQ